jgi:hypothetical protein
MRGGESIFSTEVQSGSLYDFRLAIDSAWDAVCAK